MIVSCENSTDVSNKQSLSTLNKTAKQMQSIFASNVSLEVPAIDQHAEVYFKYITQVFGVCAPIDGMDNAVDGNLDPGSR